MRVDEKVALNVIPAIDALVTHGDEDVAVLVEGLDTVAAYCETKKADLLNGVNARAAGLFDPAALAAIKAARDADVIPAERVEVEAEQD